jgi:hypothetical protein
MPVQFLFGNSVICKIAQKPPIGKTKPNFKNQKTQNILLLDIAQKKIEIRRISCLGGSKIKKVISRSEISYSSRKYMLLGIKKIKLGPQSPKIEFCSKKDKFLGI